MICSNIVTEALQTVDDNEAILDGVSVLTDSKTWFADLNEDPDECSLFGDFSCTTDNNRDLAKPPVPTRGSEDTGDLYDLLGDLETHQGSLGGYVSTAANAGSAPVGPAYYSPQPSLEASDYTSHSESDSDSSPTAGIPTLVSNIDQDAAEKCPNIRQNLKDKIRQRRESVGAGDIPVSELFEAPKQYALTPEEEQRNEVRKARNRKSATKSRLKRIEREQNLEKEYEVVEDQNSKLQSEIKSLIRIKRTLTAYLGQHVKTGACSFKRKLDQDHNCNTAQNLPATDNTKRRHVDENMPNMCYQNPSSTSNNVVSCPSSYQMTVSSDVTMTRTPPMHPTELNCAFPSVTCTNTDFMQNLTTSASTAGHSEFDPVYTNPVATTTDCSGLGAIYTYPPVSAVDISAQQNLSVRDKEINRIKSGLLDGFEGAS